MTVGNFARLGILNAVGNATPFSVATPFVSLHSSNPGVTGVGEIVGAGYGRESGSFGPAALPNEMDTDVDLDFVNMPAATITHFGVWDAVAGGNYVWGGALTTPRTVNLGDTLHFPAGALTLTQD